MTDKPKRAAEYSSEQHELVRATCLYVATKLGDLLEDIVVVGGLVPSLIVAQDPFVDGVEPHVGTLDLDLGLEVELLDSERYQELANRLRQAGFSMDANAAGNATRQRWKIEGQGKKVSLDFLIPPSRSGDRGGMLRDLLPDWAAIIAPGLSCAFRDRQRITLSGRTLLGERAERELWVCGAGAFVVLKALAFDGRGENKDAYDLYYVLRNYGTGIRDVASRLAPLLDAAEAQRALRILERDFLSPDHIGPMRVASFLASEGDAPLLADVVGFVTALLRELKHR